MKAGREKSGLYKQTGPAVFRLSVSSVKGEKKENVSSVTVTLDGIEGDAHAGSSRALSLLPFESFEKLSNDELEIQPGYFGENITTLGLNFDALRVGMKMALGDAVVVEVVQVGKECHNGCFIKQTVGDCIMPREGLFARVIATGELREGDSIRIIE